jgi:hypothetical protein
MCVGACFFYYVIKNKKGQERKQKKKTKKMHVCVYFRDLFTTRWQSIKKDLIFWSDPGVEVPTCTKVVFLNSDEKTKFLKLL